VCTFSTLSIVLSLSNSSLVGIPALLDEHENSNKENPRNREPGCIYTIEYVNSESVAHFSFITQVERQLCIVNRGYAIVTEQQ
jgi:hypothetical protein